MNILFTSAGRRGYLLEYFRAVMTSEDKIFAANSSAMCPAFAFADEYVVTPLIYDDNYIQFLLTYCINKKINAIISLFDVDLPVLAKNKSKFNEIGVKLIVSDAWFVEICNDKLKTFEFLQKNGLNTPKTFVDINHVRAAIDDGMINFPLMVKPRWGMGSIGVHQAEDWEELNFYEKKVKREISSSYLKYESKTCFDKSVIIQEKIVGNEYGLDVINDLQGRYINTVVKKKIMMRSGETDAAETVYDDEMQNIGKNISRIAKHIGNLDVDAFKDKQGKCYILEMNARFGGGYPFSHAAGVNLPLAIVKWLKHEEVDNKIFVPVKGVVAQKNIEIIKLNDILAKK